MNNKYDPKIHHRRSIRLKGHDYAGGGLYFVTICAHRDAGNIFAAADVREMVAREWVAACGGTHEGCPYVVMPDHFHALVRIPVGAGLVPARSLGDMVGAFKSRVVHEYIAGVKAGRWPRFPGKIWHRNYYEMIVRNVAAEEKITEYIRMNPWRCVMDFGNGLRGMGNPSLWNLEKLGVLCSRNAPRRRGEMHLALTGNCVALGGFHSPMEKEILAKLLEVKAPVIWCPAWGLGGKMEPEALAALEGNRMLILEMKNRDGNLAAAEGRNRFVLEQAEKLWLPHVARGGMLERLLRDLRGDMHVACTGGKNEHRIFQNGIAGGVFESVQCCTEGNRPSDCGRNGK